MLEDKEYFLENEFCKDYECQGLDGENSCNIEYTSSGFLKYFPKLNFNCFKKKCEIGQFQCSFYHFCIPIDLVCDGINHCPEGDDENDKECKIFLPSGYFKCKKIGKFIKMDKVCDGKYDCENGYDEFFCKNYTCPENCVCNKNYVLNCQRILNIKLYDLNFYKIVQFNEINKINSLKLSTVKNLQTIFIKFSNSILNYSKILNESLKYFKNLKVFVFENNRNMNENHFHLNFIPKNLQTLKIINSSINHLKTNIFKQLYHLKELDLSLNSITVLNENIFNDLTNLIHLNLSFNKILKFQPFLFKKNLNIQYLNLKRSFISINFHSYTKLHYITHKKLEKLVFDYQFICCFLPKKIECFGSIKYGLNCLKLINYKNFNYIQFIFTFINILSLIFYIFSNLQLIYYEYVYDKKQNFYSNILRNSFNYFYVISDFILFNYNVFIIYLIRKNNFSIFYVNWRLSLQSKILFVILFFLTFSSFFEQISIKINLRLLPKYFIIFIISILAELSIFFWNGWKNLLEGNPFSHPFLIPDKHTIYFICTIFLFVTFLKIFKDILKNIEKKAKFAKLFNINFLKDTLFLVVTLSIFFATLLNLNIQIKYFIIITFNFCLLKLPYKINIRKYIKENEQRKRLEKFYLNFFFILKFYFYTFFYLKKKRINQEKYFYEKYLFPKLSNIMELYTKRVINTQKILTDNHEIVKLAKNLIKIIYSAHSSDCILINEINDLVFHHVRI